MRDTRDPYENRRAVVRLNRELLAHLIGLPEGLSVVGVVSVNAMSAIEVIVEGDRLDPQPLDSYPPAIPGHPGLWAFEQMVVAGRTYVRWRWDQEPRDDGETPTRQGA